MKHTLHPLLLFALWLLLFSVPVVANAQLYRRGNPIRFCGKGLTQNSNGLQRLAHVISFLRLNKTELIYSLETAYFFSITNTRSTD
jgi:hypothetical protein